MDSIKLFYQGTVKEAKRYLVAQSYDMQGAAAGQDDDEDERSEGESSDKSS